MREKEGDEGHRKLQFGFTSQVTEAARVRSGRNQELGTYGSHKQTSSAALPYALAESWIRIRVAETQTGTMRQDIVLKVKVVAKPSAQEQWIM